MSKSPRKLKHCKRAIKILEQYARLPQKLGIKLWHARA